MSKKRKHEEDATQSPTTRRKPYNVTENINGSLTSAAEVPDLSIEILQDIYNALTAATLVQQPLLEGKHLGRSSLISLQHLDYWIDMSPQSSGPPRILRVIP
jgi:hypothetical protein